MSEPVNFSEQLRVWRQSMARSAVAREASVFADNVLPFRRELDARLEDEPLDWLRAEPWVPVVED